MTELAKIIEGYRDRHGQPSYASIARAMGVSSQTLDSWLNRGLKTAPRNKEPLHKLADLVGLDYRIIASAIAVDIGLLPEMPTYEWPKDRRGSA